MTTLTATYTLGPQMAGPLAVYPVFGPPPALHYHGLTDAIELGAFVKELDQGASVRQVIVENPTDLAILIYEGEQIRGAQQNRSVDASLLVPAKSGISVPVSCIERGRWDGARHSEPFAVSSTLPIRRCGPSSGSTQTDPGATDDPTRAGYGRRSERAWMPSASRRTRTRWRTCSPFAATGLRSSSVRSRRPPARSARS